MIVATIPEARDLVFARIGTHGIEHHAAVVPVEADASRTRAVSVLHEHRRASGAPRPARQQRDDEHHDVRVQDGGAVQDAVSVPGVRLFVGQAQELPQVGEIDERVAVDDRRRPDRLAELAFADGDERERSRTAPP